MFNNKKVLLIAGGGTLGTYTYEELLRLGCFVDVICLEDKISNNSRLKFYKAEASLEYLENLFKNNKYDAIVNFLFYATVEKYKPYHELLTANTNHLVFVSSYRVYSDMEIPITENCPSLLDVIKDEEFLENEGYALPKSRCEEFIKQSGKLKKYTIVRPVISFSANRLDLFMYSKADVIKASENNSTLYLPESAKNLTAGLDWAGNSGKLIANLLFKEEAKGEAYTISSAPDLTWSEVAEIYSRLLNVEIKWVSEEEYLKPYILKNYGWQCRYKYDRCFDRKINNEKVFNVTGLKKSDFLSIEEGLKIELKKAREKNRSECYGREINMKLSFEQIKEITTGAVDAQEENGMLLLKRFTNEQEELYRETKPSGYEKTFSTSGIKFLFKTNSENLFLKLKTMKSSTRKYFSVDVLVDGTPIGSIDNFSGLELPRDFTKMEFPLGDFSKNFRLGEGEKTVCVHLPWSVKTLISEVSIDDNAFIEGIKPKKTLLAFGDSITHGYDTLHPSGRYAAKLAERLEAEEFNKGIGGEKFFPELASLKEPFVPDYITIEYGSNDWNRIDEETFKYNSRAFYENIVRNYPNSKIFTITPLWRKDMNFI